MFKKSLLELQYLEEQKLYAELKKVEDAEYYYRLLKHYKSLALMVFVMNLIVISAAAIYELLLIETDGFAVSVVIMCFNIASFVLLCASSFYKNKTMKLLEQHYQKEAEAK